MTSLVTLCLIGKGVLNLLTLFYWLNRMGYLSNKSALLFSVSLHYQNHFGLNKGGIDLFYIYFIIRNLSVNYKNIKTLNYNSDSITLRLLILRV